MSCLGIPAGPSPPGALPPSPPAPAVDDALKLGLLRAALLASERAAELLGRCMDSYPEATEGIRGALAALGESVRLPDELEQLRWGSSRGRGLRKTCV